MTANYSLVNNAAGVWPTDGFRAPRWVHWVVKVATGLLFTVPVWWIATFFCAPQAALGAGLGSALGSFFVTKSFNIKWSGPRSTWTPKEPNTFTLDFAFDFTLNLLPWLVLAHVGWPVGLVATVLLLALYPYASP